MFTKQWSLLASLIVFFAVPVFAQTVERDDESHTWLRALSSANSESTGTGFESEVSIEAGDSEAKASLTITRLSKLDAEGRVRRYQLRASAPFDSDKSDSIDIGTLSGLTAGTSVAFEASWMHWPVVPEDDWSALEANCLNRRSDFFPGFQDVHIAQSGIVLCSRGKMNRATLQAVLADLKTRLPACKKTLSEAKSRADRKTLGYRKCQILADVVDTEPKLVANADKLLKQRAEEFDSSIERTIKRISLFTVGVKANQQKFDYLLAADPTSKISDSKNGWSVSAAYTQVRRRWLWSAGFSHEESYKGGPAAQICVPFGTGGALSCSNAATAAPTKSTKELLFVEIRQIVPGMNIALSPRVEFDLDDAEWAIQLPLYLVRNKKGAFTAGLAFGWSSVDTDLGASIFVGKSFEFFE